jgi:hypothetical protein
MESYTRCVYQVARHHLKGISSMPDAPTQKPSNGCLTPAANAVATHRPCGSSSETETPLAAACAGIYARYRRAGFSEAAALEQAQRFARRMGVA